MPRLCALCRCTSFFLPLRQCNMASAAYNFRCQIMTPQHFHRQQTAARRRRSNGSASYARLSGGSNAWMRPSSLSSLIACRLLVFSRSARTSSAEVEDSGGISACDLFSVLRGQSHVEELRLIPAFVRPEWTRIVVAGNPDMYWQRGYVSNHAQGRPTTRIVHGSTSWRERVGVGAISSAI